MIELLQLLVEHSPSLGIVAILLVCVYLAARHFGGAELRDLRARVDYLDQQVHALRYRDECYFAYVLYDQDYHNRLELFATTAGYKLEKHQTFLKFRDEWMKDRELDDEEEEIWK